MSQDLSQFRQDVRNWLGDNFPKSLIGRGIEPFGGVEGEASIPEDASSWRDRLGEKGWGTPTWPSEYGGGGLLFLLRIHSIAQQQGLGGVYV